MNYKKTIIPPIGEEERKRIMENALYGIKENIKKPKGVKQDKKITREEHNKRLSIANKNKSFKDILQKYGITNTNQANDCAELWNINNGVTLCGECHRKLHQGEIEL